MTRIIFSNHAIVAAVADLKVQHLAAAQQLRREYSAALAQKQATVDELSRRLAEAQTVKAPFVRV